MTAGSNHIIDLWKYAYQTDDVIGGSRPTGTVHYENIPCKISAIEPTMALVEQGLETDHFCKFHVHVLDVNENDEVEVKLPKNSWYYGKRFRVISIQHHSLHPSDPRAYMILIGKRTDKSHAIQK